MLARQILQGSLYDTNAKPCTTIREIPENYHTFTLFDPPNMDNFMSPVIMIPKPEFFGRILGEIALQSSPFGGIPLAEVPVICLC